MKAYLIRGHSKRIFLGAGIHSSSNDVSTIWGLCQYFGAVAAPNSRKFKLCTQNSTTTVTSREIYLLTYLIVSITTKRAATDERMVRRC